MLQQTRVAAVIPYYERFLALFPDRSRAGLGPRARSARGLGRIGILLARAQLAEGRARHCRVAPVSARLCGAARIAGRRRLHSGGGGQHRVRMPARGAGWKCSAGAEPHGGRARRHQIGCGAKKLRALAETLLDRKRPGEFNQALMELGATVCVPKQPLCGHCPIRVHCQARQQGVENQLPLNGVRPSASRQEKHLLVIEKGNKILLWQRPADSRRLAGFWELPEREQVPSATVQEAAGEFRHTIVNTTYLVRVYRASVRSHPDGLQWLAESSLADFPVSTTAKKALALIESYRVR